MVTYVYKGSDLGYSSFIEECASCSSPVNVVDKIDRMSKPGMPAMPGGEVIQPQMNVPAGQPRVTRPAIIR